MNRSRPRRRRTEDGAGAITMVLGALVVLLVAAAVAGPVAEVVTAAGSARSAADAAALAAAGASPLSGGDARPCAAAATLAAANHARLVACSGPDRDGLAPSAGPPWPRGVQIRVEVDLRGPLSRLGPLRAEAAAEVRPP